MQNITIAKTVLREKQSKKNIYRKQIARQYSCRKNLSSRVRGRGQPRLPLISFGRRAKFRWRFSYRIGVRIQEDPKKHRFRTFGYGHPCPSLPDVLPCRIWSF